MKLAGLLLSTLLLVPTAYAGDGADSSETKSAGPVKVTESKPSELARSQAPTQRFSKIRTTSVTPGTAGWEIKDSDAMARIERAFYKAARKLTRPKLADVQIVMHFEKGDKYQKAVLRYGDFPNDTAFFKAVSDLHLKYGFGPHERMINIELKAPEVKSRSRVFKQRLMAVGRKLRKKSANQARPSKSHKAAKRPAAKSRSRGRR